MTRTFLLPITQSAAPLGLSILHAATTTHVATTATTGKSLAFRVVLAPDTSQSVRESVRQLRDTFPHVLPERSDYVVDLSKSHEIAHAMEACDGVVLASRAAEVGGSGSDPLLLETELNLLAAAKIVELPHLVKLSCSPGLLGERSTLESGRAHWRIEQEIRDARTLFAGDVSFVRSTTRMDAFLRGRLHDMVCGRTLSVSVKRGSVALVHPQDVAEAVVRLAHGPAAVADAATTAETQAQMSSAAAPATPPPPSSSSSSSSSAPAARSIGEYNLTGPEALTYAQMAQKLSHCLGERVRYSYFPLWAVQTSLWIKGVRPDAIASDIALASALESGAEAHVTSAVAELLGHAPRTFDEFVREHQHAWPLQSYR